MKRLWLLLFVTTGLGYPVFGQSNYGIKAGLAFSTIKEDPGFLNIRMQLKPGLQIGAFLDLQLQRNLRLRPAIQLTQKGYKSRLTNLQPLIEWKRNYEITYLELPLEIVLQLPVKPTINGFIGAGPVLGYALNGRGKTRLTETDSTGTVSINEQTGRNPFDEGLTRLDFGASVTAGVRVKKILININYNHGFRDIADKNLTFITVKTRSFSLNFSYILGRL